jgi:ABC-2 type transport system ATP-binding protein
MGGFRRAAAMALVIIASGCGVVGTAAAAGPEGCVVSDPPNPGFFNPCTYRAGDSGMYAASGAWELSVRRGDRTIVRSSASGDPAYDTSFVQAGDIVTARALSKGSSITVGNPFPAQNAPASDWAVPPHVTESRQTISFDGTRIAWTLWLPADSSAEHPVPVILGGPGWSGTSSDYDPADDPATAWALSTGYAVAAFDPRGFGGSGGQAELDSVDYEGRDVSALIDDLGRDPRIVKDGPDDPRIGMIGGSYGGAIQFVAASRDPRIDAITPDDTWNDLVRALLPDGVFRIGWMDFLTALGAKSAYVGSASLDGTDAHAGAIDPMIPRAAAEGSATGEWSPAVRDWFGARGVSALLARVHAPTLLLHGEHDTLFAPSQAAASYRTMHADHPRLPLHLVLYCGGHGTCSPDQLDYEQYDRIDAWFRRWLKGDTSVDLGPRVEYATQDGIHHAAPQFPIPAHWFTISGPGGLVADRGDQPQDSPAHQPGRDRRLPGGDTHLARVGTLKR